MNLLSRWHQVSLCSTTAEHSHVRPHLIPKSQPPIYLVASGKCWYTRDEHEEQLYLNRLIHKYLSELSYLCLTKCRILDRNSRVGKKRWCVMLLTMIFRWNSIQGHVAKSQTEWQLVHTCCLCLSSSVTSTPTNSNINKWQRMIVKHAPPPRICIKLYRVGSGFCQS